MTDLEQAKRKAQYCLWVLFLVLVCGILGMKFLLDLTWVDAVFYTITTLATVGFEAPPHMDADGKLFMVVLILTGFGVMGFAVGQLTHYFLVDRVLLVLGRRRDRMLEKMSGHWVLCGLGRVGTQVGVHFEEDRVPFVAVEKNEESCQAAQDRGWHVLHGSATGEEILRTARVDRAVGLVATLDNDADNVYVVLCARSLNKDLRIVARANEPQSASVLYRAGADKVINPVLTGATAIAAVATNPKMTEFLHDLADTTRRLDLEFDSLRLAADSPLAGRTLAEANLRSTLDMLVLAIERDGQPRYNPPGNYLLQGGDELYVLGKREHMGELRHLVSGSV